MSRTYTIPVLATAQIRDWREVYNNAHDTHLTMHKGSGLPSYAKAGMVYFDSATDKLMVVDSAGTAGIELGDVGDLNTQLGHLRKDGAEAMTGNLKLEANSLLLDADNDTGLSAATDDTLDFNVAGASVVALTATQLDFKEGVSLKDLGGWDATASGGSRNGRIAIPIAGAGGTIYVHTYTG